MLNLKGKKLILASASPRRKELLSGLNIAFTIRIIDTNEEYPASLEIEKVAIFLANKKSDAYFEEMAEDEIIITSDTTVIKDKRLYNKPENENDAKAMLSDFSDSYHKVITGVCIRSREKKISFDSESLVKFKKLEEDEINYYIENYKPFDKAGSYGIQEWLGYIAIERIEGSYFNIMGLPVHRIYEELRRF